MRLRRNTYSTARGGTAQAHRNGAIMTREAQRKADEAAGKSSYLTTPLKHQGLFDQPTWKKQLNLHNGRRSKQPSKITLARCEPQGIRK
jgi:hypothetical protein